MSSGSTLVTLVAAGALSLVVGGCGSRTAIHGNLIEPDRVSEIREGVSRRDDVATLLGTPTVVATFDPNIWYYISQKTEQTAFFAPEAVERNVLIVRFDPTSGTVRSMDKLDITAGQDVEFSDRRTPTAGKELGFLEQLFGNVGRFSARQRQSGPGQQ